MPAVVDMNAGRNQRFKDPCRRLNVQGVLLLGPVSQLGMCNLFLDRNVDVLVDWCQPVFQG